MHNNPTGSMLMICKKYTETAKNIRWKSTGEVFCTPKNPSSSMENNKA